MRKIFVLVEHENGRIDEATWEMATAARRAGEGSSTAALLLGADVTALAERLQDWFDEVVVVDDKRLSVPDGELTAAALAPLMEIEKPFCLLAAHSNHTMDFMPALSIRLGRPIVTDCLSLDLSGDTVAAVRPAYGAKVHVKVRAASSENGYLATLRPGALAMGECPSCGGVVRTASIPEEMPVRRRVIETVEGEAGQVDISQSEKLVAVGRGLQEQEDLEMIESLAEALGADVACSRPVVDRQWLPKARQVGTSGVTVRPRIYLAVGISGAFQHIGGVKGDPYLVAINRDAAAPIFASASVGIVGDLYDIVPLLDNKIRSLKG